MHVMSLRIGKVVVFIAIQLLSSLTLFSLGLVDFLGSKRALEPRGGEFVGQPGIFDESYHHPLKEKSVFERSQPYTLRNYFSTVPT